MSDPSAPTAFPRQRARTLLLTILGSMTAPHDLVLWHETYVALLCELGLSESAARQALARAGAAGWIESERAGRRTRLRVPGAHREGLATASARIERFGRPFDWDGEWLVVILKVPEQARSLRHHVRTQLGWLGFGSLGNGVWISPHGENEQAALALLSSAEDPLDAYAFRSARSVGISPEKLATAAWDMPSLHARYSAFLDTFRGLSPDTPRSAWTPWVNLVTAWRHFPLFDPELPEHLLPEDWPRAEAFRLFHRCDDRWAPLALEHAREIERRVDG
ncbi:PaaX family transcriptional regulator C-terminal domain-containing protein [Microbacterium sp.]|uniref:PaaX family transcriptional regulator n=1 Tax=Microbacterium sp. TaxID=51671 RepID=UPI000927207F|nr:PaaX family transcriptional regulator C-terminal domain-containing protein [Microbacterium sp.]MBN9192016.1 hypothetical protein [Microbacterium sp.]OJU58275.1 MAG: hypothetical protein BGO04_02035 [Microbacterium sp. 70-38]